jgi:hypothetical protein
MPSVAEVVRRYGPASLERFGDRMPAAHERVLRAIAGCRTAELGTVVYRCADCGRMHLIGRSCGDRHCPSCQRDKAEAWLTKQVDRLLPCPYFLVTFTLPSERRAVARSHQRAAYGALFRASSEALRAVMADPRHLGTPRPGFFGVLHAWGRALEYHPHVHYVVPGGGPGAERDRWLASRPGFLVPVKPLSIVFRAKFRDLLRAEGLLESVDPAVWRRDWVVHCQPAGDGRRSLRYRAPYVFRVAIGDHRIVSCEDDRVTFTYRKVGSNRRRTMTLEAMEFLRRFLQHVLPSGLQQVRYYGFLGPAAGVSLELVRWLIAIRAGLTSALSPARDGSPRASAEGPRCPACGGRLVRLGVMPAAGPSAFDTSSSDDHSEPIPETIDRPAAVPRPGRGARRVRDPAGRRCRAGRSRRAANRSSSPPERPAPWHAALPRPIAGRLSRHRRRSTVNITLVKRPAAERPGSLNMAWWSGCADLQALIVRLRTQRDTSPSRP